MDAMAIHAKEDPFVGSDISNENENLLADIWEWCTIQGCRAVCLSGRLFMKKSAWSKFRLVAPGIAWGCADKGVSARHVVLTGGCLVAFKVKSKQVFHQRTNRYPLFGAYVSEHVTTI